MNISQQIAKHFRDVHFGGNWTTVNLKDTLADVTWQQAITQVQSFNTIATLTYHVNYFVSEVLKVLQGHLLEAHDSLSFSHPPINNQADWDSLVSKALNDGEQFAALVAQLPDDVLMQDFTDGKYGNYYRNLTGIIEHTHYHLGQIVFIKKLVQANTNL